MKFPGICSVLGLALVIVTGCSSSKKTVTVQKQESKNNVVCSNATKDNSYPRVEWMHVDNPAKEDVKDFTLPASFTTYYLDNAQLKAFFGEAKKEGSATYFSVPLNPSGCESFGVHKSSTMAQELADKNPDMVSLQGNAVGNPTADIRLDYNGTGLNGQVTWNGKIYLIAPVKYGNSTVHIVYEKTEPAYKKRVYQNNSNMSAAPTSTADR